VVKVDCGELSMWGKVATRFEKQIAVIGFACAEITCRKNGTETVRKLLQMNGRCII
jgi:hypothetical protein